VKKVDKSLKTREWARLRQNKPDTGQQSENRDRAHRPKLKGKRTEQHKRRCKKRTLTAKQQSYIEKRNLNSGTLIRGPWPRGTFEQEFACWRGPADTVARDLNPMICLDHVEPFGVK
jgi:hypothetical protein